MEKAEVAANAYDMIYLTECAINGKTPDKSRVESMDLEKLFAVCQNHILTACTAYALESAGFQSHEFTQAKEKAIRKNILMDVERGKITKRLEQEHIWHMPLKGVLTKNWYPKQGMRQMSDNDILCDVSYRKHIREIMEELGFKCTMYDSGKDDVYHKQPFYSFEMHFELFNVIDDKTLYDYYANVRERLLLDEGSQYGYHFSNEDFYLYMIAHEYKHYIKGGTGVRSLVDQYIFMRKFGDSFRWDYARAELDRMGIRDYEEKTRSLAMKLFGEAVPISALSPEEDELLNLHIFSGIYGSLAADMEQRLQNEAGGSRVKLALNRIFPSMDNIKTWWPFFYRHKWLIPLLWIIRPVKALISNRKRLFGELQFIFSKKKDQ